MAIRRVRPRARHVAPSANGAKNSWRTSSLSRSPSSWLPSLFVRSQRPPAGAGPCRWPAAHPAGRHARAPCATRRSRNAVFPSPALPVMMTSR